MAGENRKKTTTDLQRGIKGLVVGLKRMYANVDREADLENEVMRRNRRRDDDDDDDNDRSYKF
ncbi:BQ5605_C007g04850 [Microbotryum silenes-dioicae]|uniref:BQ5605_C007g04850 protein n=1 Tax=Microbotryum silenes-dioicae TaxID=796604 RepID=A0A2X0M861_9BASI|nr:BQ5605_C007g04850 [Microbotryum silenes-dioicae]